MMATTTDRDEEVRLTMEFVLRDEPMTDSELQKLLWYRDQKLNAAMLNRTPTETGENISQK
jgi:hypothetical protein